MGFVVFRDWKRELLEVRGLAHPDGRPLYAYRLSDVEFNELEELLRDWLGKLQERFGLTQLTKLSGFSGLFVLYGSEWWRRRFDGAHWSWDPILSELGADPGGWSPPQRSEFVRLGLQDWGLKPRAQGGLRFLGAVALQGGLPLRLLAEARGGIGRLLNQVLRLAANGAASQADLLSWVRSLDRSLPQTYRQEAIQVLLADVVRIVLDLRDEAGLQPGVDAIARLDDRVPAWRDRFPLPVEDEHAAQLIEQLIRDVAGSSTERTKTCLPLVRRIVAFDESTWALESGFELPDSLPASQLAAVFRIEESDLPRFADLTIRSVDTATTMAIRRLAGVEKFRIDRHPFAAGGSDAAGEHFLELSASNGLRWSVTAPRGEELDDELPWVFAPDDGGYRLVAQGGGKVAAVEVLVALSSGWAAKATNGAATRPCGMLIAPQRTVFRARGTIMIEANGGLLCTLRTGEAAAREESYAWRGERVWLDFQRPTMAFRGCPQLYMAGEDGSLKKVDGKLSWSSAVGQGPVVASLSVRGSIAHRSRLLLLPDTAEVALVPHDAHAGSLSFKRWGVASACILTDGINSIQHRSTDSLTLQLSIDPGRGTPEQIDIELLWPHTTTTAKLRIPFPAKGVRFIDAEGAELPGGALVAVQGLTGTRMSIIAGVTNQKIALELQARSGGEKRIHSLQRPADSLQLTLRPSDFAGEIHHLLSLDDRPDARVQLRVRIGGAEQFSVDIARYAAILDRNTEGGYLYCSGGSGLSVREREGLRPFAMCLERPGDEPFALTALQVDEPGSDRGWAFSSMVREPGSWLIYPAADGGTLFRPTLWRIEGDAMAQSPLACTLTIVNAAERETALDGVIAEMAADYQHEGWADLEQLALQLGHLPLATLDLWRRFARSAYAMAALVFRFGRLAADFVDRFADELPFAWETVGFSAWKTAIGNLQSQCLSNFGDAGEAVFGHYLKSRIEALTARHGALQYLVGIACSPYDAEAAKHAGLLRYLGSLSDGKLLGDDDSLVMRLMRTHASSQWPGGSNVMVASAHADPKLASFLCPQDFGFHNGAINMPLLLAAQAAQDRTAQWFGDPASVQLLRTHRAFDPEWFDEAYNFTISCCLAQGILDT